MIRRVFALFKNLLQRNLVEREIDEELRATLDILTEEKCQQGVPFDEARRRALIEVGGVEQVKEKVRSVKTGRFFFDLLKDLRFSMRLLRRNPGFSTVAVVTLALGIGATTAIFSLVDAVFLNDLPYRDADRIVYIARQNLKLAIPWNHTESEVWEASARSCDLVAEFSQGRVPFSVGSRGQETPLLVNGTQVSSKFFSIFGVPAAIGRTFSPSDADASASPSIVISQRLFESRFSGDRAMIGQQIGRSTLIGVMPHDFQFPPKTDFWTISNQVDGNIIARLAPAASIPQVKTEFDTMLARLRAEKSTYIDHDAHSEVVSLREYLVGDMRISILILLGAVGMVMLIVCINVANLLLLRNQKRRHEMSVRAAIGATRFRLARQTIAESGLLSIFGGALGVLLAWWIIHLLPRLAPPGVLNEHGIALDMRVLLFAVFITVLTGILVALLPALHQPWSTLADAMKRSGSHEATGSRGLFHHLLVPVQIALTLAVLCGAGLMIRSFIVLRGGYPGIHNNSLMKLDIFLQTRQLNKLHKSALPARTLNPAAYANALKQREQDFEDIWIQQAHTCEKMLDQIRMLSEVKRAAATNRLPGAIRRAGMIVRPKRLPANSGVTAVITYASPDYFEILGIPVTAGRTFSKFDDQQSAARVAIINQKLANILYPGENPIGKKLPTYIMGSTTPNSISEIVGVVRDFRNRGFREAPFPEAFIPLNRPILGEFLSEISVVAETHGAARPTASSFREAVSLVDPETFVYDAMTMDDYIETFMVRDRFSVLLLSLFGATTLMLAAVGIYGVMAQSVEHRLREVAVRIALGASRGQVIRLVLRRGVAQIGCGLAAGLLGAFYITRALRSVLLQANPYDPITFATVILLLLAVACLACYIPARRATKVDPLTTLHAE